MDASPDRGSNASNPDRSPSIAMDSPAALRDAADRSPSIAMDSPAASRHAADRSPMDSPAGSRDGERGSGGAAAVPDRLSALPDRVLRDVLSCLTSLQAARTSALSRRWRHLWRAVASRVVDIDHRDTSPAAADPRAMGIFYPFYYFIDAARMKRERLAASDEPWHRFEDLADRLTLAHDGSSPPLDAFRLRVDRAGFPAAGKWIRRGLARRPAALHLCIDNDDPDPGPDDDTGDGGWPCFPVSYTAYAAGGNNFTCRLTTLRLSGLCLPSCFEDAVSADFPVLEDLELHACRCEFVRLASASLRRLSIEYRGHAYHVDELVLMAPLIVSLRVVGDAPPVALEHETPLPCLVEATLAHRAGDLGVLRSLRGARSLKLCSFSTVALLDDGEPGGFPAFGNLRALVLDGCDVGAGCHVLRRFLRNAPRLETLTLRNCLRSREFSGGAPVSRRSRKRKERAARRERSGDRRAPPAYPCRNLKLIELKFFDDHALLELAGVLRDISKEVVHPIEGSAQDGMRTVKIYYA